MKRRLGTALVVLSLAYLATAGVGAFGFGLPRVEGRLVELRSQFTSGARGDWRVYEEFVAAKANLPLGVLTPKGKVIYLVVEPERLALYVGSKVRAEGVTAREGRFFRPDRLQVQVDDQWRPIDLKRN